MSPVCSKNAGADGSASTFAIAARNVPVTSGFAALLNPIWLSLICANVKSPPPLPLAAASPPPAAPFITPSNACDFNTPPTIVQITPVPAHAIHSKNPRRSSPSLFKLSLIYLGIASFAPGAAAFRIQRLFVPTPASAAASHSPLPNEAQIYSQPQIFEKTVE